MAESVYSMNLVGGLTFTAGAVVNFTGATVSGLTLASTTFAPQNYINVTGGDTSFYINTSTLALPTAAGNTAIGVGAGNIITSGTGNTIIGSGAGSATTTGFNNTCVGYLAAAQLSTGAYNAIYGVSSGSFNTSGGANSYFGSSAGYANSTGNSNTYLGYQSGINATGNANTCVGSSTAVNLTTGTGVTCLGYQSNVGSAGLTQATAIGQNATVLASNTVQLGQAGIDTVNVGKQLTINAIQLTDNHAHIVSGSGLPAIAFGAGTGTTGSPSATLGAGSTDISGVINVTTGSNPTGSATIVTVTFVNAYANAPRVIVTPGNYAAASLSADSQEWPFIGSTSTTNFVFQSNVTALAVTTAYVWYYLCAS
jgi:trimeric autotransporter adhesin